MKISENTIRQEIMDALVNDVFKDENYNERIADIVIEKTSFRKILDFYHKNKPNKKSKSKKKVKAKSTEKVYMG